MKDKYTNFLGIDFVAIKPGSFIMGNLQGIPEDDPMKKFARQDEEPVHQVTISTPFLMATAPVTNKQYEQYDPGHVAYRGKNGFSKGDDEAVVFVNWYEAKAYCDWLSDKEGLHYRLPTEAEWEYAVRAGTSTGFYMGDDLPANYQQPDLAVRRTPANPWGLHDLHGLVEEWCSDWYGPYCGCGQRDPLGYAQGEFKVLRGGSHSTDNEYLRSANRMAQVPEARNWLMGFRMVIGELPKGNYIHLQEKRQPPKIHPIALVPQDTSKPYFRQPQTYINLENYEPPFGFHNHQPALTGLPNGDLLALWYTTQTEKGRELRQAASRFSAQKQRWGRPYIFWLIPDRNIHGCDLFWDQDSNVVYHFSGIAGAENDGRSLAVAMRKSFDNGFTWTPPRMINPEFNHRGQVISSTIKTKDGKILVLCDDLQDGGSAVYISEDGGLTWFDPGVGQPAPIVKEGETGAWIAGIHAAVVELDKGRLFAAGRGNNINRKMPFSVSIDGGLTWRYSASEFPPVSSGQRLAMIGLQEGPLLLISFTDRRDLPGEKMAGILGYDAQGNQTRITGMFAAVSFDEGKTWPIKRVISDGSGRRVDSTDPNQYEAHAGNKNANRIFTMDAASGEAMGYLALIQAKNGIIHLISSRQHYQFNYKWLVEYR